MKVAEMDLQNFLVPDLSEVKEERHWLAYLQVPGINKVCEYKVLSVCAGNDLPTVGWQETRHQSCMLKAPNSPPEETTWRDNLWQTRVGQRCLPVLLQKAKMECKAESYNSTEASVSDVLIVLAASCDVSKIQVTRFLSCAVSPWHPQNLDVTTNCIQLPQHSLYFSIYCFSSFPSFLNVRMNQCQFHYFVHNVFFFFFII